MFFIKNVPSWERGLRIAAGVAMSAWGYWGLGASITGYAFLAMGAIAVFTGFVGFCPVCALAGRKPRAGGKR